MCQTSNNLDARLQEMEAAAEQLSLVQQKVNTPMFDLLFKLVNMPQTPSMAGGKLKVLHTYAHRFLEFYMTECPDGVSIHAINPGSIHELSAKLRTLGDGLGRLLMYLGLESENVQLMEQVDTLAVAYDAFAVVMMRVDEARDQCCMNGCDCDCDCDCDRCCDNEDETSWVNEHHEDDDAEEFDPEDEPAAEDANRSKAEEELESLFKAIFGFNPSAATPKEAPKPNAKEDIDPFAKEMTHILSRLFGLNESEVTVHRVQNEELKQKNEAAQDETLHQKQAAKKNEEKPQVHRIVVREVTPGFWRFG